MIKMKDISHERVACVADVADGQGFNFVSGAGYERGTWKNSEYPTGIELLKNLP